MSDEQHAELRSNGFVIVKDWAVLLTVLTIFLTIVIFAVELRGKVLLNGSRIDELEAWKRQCEKERVESLIIHERIDNNIKRICEKLNIKQ